MRRKWDSSRRGAWLDPPRRLPQTLWWQLLRQKLPFSSSAVRSWSGGLAGAQHDRTLDTGTRPAPCVLAAFQSLASGKFSQRAKRAHHRASERKKTLRSSVQGPVRPQIPVGGLGGRVTSGGGRRAHTSGFLSWAGCVRLDLWAENEASRCVCGSKSCNPPLLCLSPSPPLCTPPLLLIWMTCQTKALDANTL